MEEFWMKFPGNCYKVWTTIAPSGIEVYKSLLQLISLTNYSPRM